MGKYKRSRWRIAPFVCKLFIYPSEPLANFDKAIGIVMTPVKECTVVRIKPLNILGSSRNRVGEFEAF